MPNMDGLRGLDTERLKQTNLQRKLEPKTLVQIDRAANFAQRLGGGAMLAVDFLD